MRFAHNLDSFLEKKIRRAKLSLVRGRLRFACGIGHRLKGPVRPGGLWFLDNRILWTPNGNASNSVDSQQRLEELPKSLESIGFIANRFG
jgi:hypothetical protein